MSERGEAKYGYAGVTLIRCAPSDFPLYEAEALERCGFDALELEFRKLESAVLIRGMRRFGGLCWSDDRVDGGMAQEALARAWGWMGVKVEPGDCGPSPSPYAPLASPHDSENE